VLRTSESFKTARALGFTAAGMLLSMTAYEVLKDFLRPDITRWESHAITIIFSTVIATTAAYIIRRRLARRNQELAEALHAKDATEAENALAIAELRQALADVKQLRGLLPICAHCKSIRNDSGYWSTVESYLSEHTAAEFSHGICPECLQKYYSELLEVKGAA
jgi:hypothetical protein